MTRILLCLYAVLVMALMSLGIPAHAESIDGKTSAQIAVDNAVQAQINTWALNKFRGCPR